MRWWLHLLPCCFNIVKHQDSVSGLDGREDSLFVQHGTTTSRMSYLDVASALLQRLNKGVKKASVLDSKKY